MIKNPQLHYTGYSEEKGFMMEKDNQVDWEIITIIILTIVIVIMSYISFV